MDRHHKLIMIDDLTHRVVEQRDGIIVYAGNPPQMRQCHYDYPEFISQRETRQDHSFKYVVLGIDEEFKRRFPSRYTLTTTI